MASDCVAWLNANPVGKWKSHTRTSFKCFISWKLCGAVGLFGVEMVHLLASLHWMLVVVIALLLISHILIDVTLVVYLYSAVTVNSLHLNILIRPCNLIEAEDFSDAIISGEEDNGGRAVSNKNMNEINGNWLSSSSNSIHEARLKAKAKRRLRKNSSRDSGRGDSLSDNGDAVRGNSAAPTSPKSKLLDRKSRLGKGRGLPKKGMMVLCFLSYCDIKMVHYLRW